MIRYLYYKVNLWEGMYFFSILEDQMVDNADKKKKNGKKKGTGYLLKMVLKMGPGPIFSRKRGPGKKGDRSISSIKWGLAPFLAACPLFM